MGGEGIKKNDISRLGRAGDKFHVLHIFFSERCPFFEHTPVVVACGYFEASVFLGSFIDANECRDAEFYIVSPTGLMILMRLKPSASRELEIDFFLE